MPNIILNMGIFFYYYDDYENALATLLRYREKVKSIDVNELISLLYLIQGNYKDAIKEIKRNIMLDPKSVKYRFQLAYANEKRIETVLHDKERPGAEIRASYETLRRSNRIYHYYSKTNINELLKNEPNPEFKDKIKPLYLKIKGISEERKPFVKSRLDYYERAEE